MKIKFTLIIAFIILSFTKGFAQQTVGLFTDSTGNLDGYVLFDPVASDTTYLIDKCGKLIHTWGCTHRAGLSAYLLPDGNLLRCGTHAGNHFNGGGKGGFIQKIAWNSNLLWSYTIYDSLQCQHHDVCQLPNGNVLAIVWEAHTKTDAINNGRIPTQVTDTMWSEKIIEIQPIGLNGGNIVWQWHAWDHLVQHYDATKLNYDSVQLHHELINLNYNTSSTIPDWLHINSVFYDTVYDQIILSSFQFSEVWVIDHGTTTVQAASHSGGHYGKGGDLLYRWGNPAAYGLGDISTEKFFNQHNANIIPYGFRDERKILVFNNGNQRPGGNYSTVEVFQPPIDSLGNYDTTIIPFMPSSSSWIYTASVPTSLYSQNMGGAQRLSNGNTLICDADYGIFFEIDTNNNTVWKYICPVNGSGRITQGNTPLANNSFRCTLYEPAYSGFIGHTLTPGNPIEINPLNYVCSMLTSNNGLSDNKSILNIYPNPANDETNIIISGISSQSTDYSLQLYDVLGNAINIIYSINKKNENISFKVNTKELQNGVYFCKISIGDNSISVCKFVVSK